MDSTIRYLRRFARRGLPAVALVLAVAFASACGKTPSGAAAGDSARLPGDAEIAGSAAGKIRIAAAEPLYGEVAQAVGGERAEVKSLISGAEADPHDYDPTPEAAKAVESAQLVIYNGLGYDDWMKKLLNASRDNRKKVIVVGTDVAGKKSGDNEHVWYDPGTMPKLAEAVAARLSELDPPHADEYRQNARRYIDSLAPLNELIARLKQPAPAPVAVSEPVFDYLLQALNMTVTNGKFAKAVEEETDPAPGDVARLTDDIANKNIRLFFRNVQTDSPLIRQFAERAKQNGIPVVEVTEFQPAGKSYVQWMTDQLLQVEKAIGARPSP
jgi:zinc/manganese transport system substrate-binding protein